MQNARHCEASVDGIVSGSFEARDESIGTDVRYTLVRCPRCSDPILLAQLIEVHGEWDEPSQIFPSQQKISPAVPKEIGLTFAEALACLKAKAYTACAIMCRKTVEGISSAHGVHERTLLDSLKRLKDTGVIEHRLFDWADALRIVGNEAAHDVHVSVSRHDAKDLVDFTNALLEYIFTFREKFEKFKQRRGSAA